MPICNHKEFHKDCKFCTSTRTTRNDRADEFERDVMKAYEVGGFRGIVHLFMKGTT